MFFLRPRRQCAKVTEHKAHDDGAAQKMVFFSFFTRPGTHEGGNDVRNIAPIIMSVL